MIMKILMIMLVMIFTVTTITPAYAAKTGKNSAVVFVKKFARTYGVPKKIALAVCHVESHCNCGVRRGAAGEIGPMQVKPRTARGIGMSLKGCENQVKAGLKYLGMAIKRGGYWKYNQGIYAKRKSKAASRYERLVEAAQ
jgi:soluble lytic murein transglycosylase-like protein